MVEHAEKVLMDTTKACVELLYHITLILIKLGISNVRQTNVPFHFMGADYSVRYCDNIIVNILLAQVAIYVSYGSADLFFQKPIISENNTHPSA